MAAVEEVVAEEVGVEAEADMGSDNQASTRAGSARVGEILLEEL